MKTFLNRIIFNQINLDSASLTLQGSIVHMFREPGEYYGEIKRNDSIVGRFRLLVGDEHKNKQVNIDLKSLDLPTGKHEQCRDQDFFTLTTGGYCVFHVSDGLGGYTFNVYQSGKNPNERPFDSRELQDGDVFTASIIRPGVYQAINMKNKSSLEILVPYPKRSDKRLTLEPVTVQCTDKAIKPGKIKLQPGNGIIFSIKAPARIKIEIKKPINRPERFKEPGDVPRSIERKVLAVINSYNKPEFISKYFGAIKEKTKKTAFAEKLLKSRKETGRFGDLQKLYDITGHDEEDFTKIVNSLLKAYTELTSLSRS